jgi:hypothetical protein
MATIASGPTTASILREIMPLLLRWLPFLHAPRYGAKG